MRWDAVLTVRMFLNNLLVKIQLKSEILKSQKLGIVLVYENKKKVPKKLRTGKISYTTTLEWEKFKERGESRGGGINMSGEEMT